MGVVSTHLPDEFIYAVVSMVIEIKQGGWVEEVLDDSVVGMLNVQCDKISAPDDSD
jgi:hypothetical protein